MLKKLIAVVTPIKEKTEVIETHNELQQHALKELLAYTMSG